MYKAARLPEIPSACSFMLFVPGLSLTCLSLTRNCSSIPQWQIYRISQYPAPLFDFALFFSLFSVASAIEARRRG
jgi:hypothetical protein